MRFPTIDHNLQGPLTVTIGVGGAIGLGFWGLIRKIDQISKQTVVKHSGEFHVAQSEEKLIQAMKRMHEDMERVRKDLKNINRS